MTRHPQHPAGKIIGLRPPTLASELHAHDGGGATGVASVRSGVVLTRGFGFHVRGFNFPVAVRFWRE
jgi:hypothetical protein